MKQLFIIMAFLSALTSRAQNVSTFTVQTNCPVTIQAPVDSALIFGSASITGDVISGYQWKQLSGPSTAVLVTPTTTQTIARKLVAGVYTFSLTATSKAGAVQTVVGSQITVLPAPVPPRKVVKVTYTLVNNIWTATYTYDDGSSSN